MGAILGLNITKVLAEKKKTNGGNIEITTQPAILDVSEVKLPGIAKDLSVLNVGFTFNSTYKPDAGAIAIEGLILYKADSNESVLQEWKKSKALPQLDGAIILNHILSKVSIIGLYLSDLLQLPPIVGLPKIELKAERAEAKKK